MGPRDRGEGEKRVCVIPASFGRDWYWVVGRGGSWVPSQVAAASGVVCVAHRLPTPLLSCKALRGGPPFSHDTQSSHAWVRWLGHTDEKVPRLAVTPLGSSGPCLRVLCRNRAADLPTWTSTGCGHIAKSGRRFDLPGCDGLANTRSGGLPPFGAAGGCHCFCGCVRWRVHFWSCCSVCTAGVGPS